MTDPLFFKKGPNHEGMVYNFFWTELSSRDNKKKLTVLVTCVGNGLLRKIASDNPWRKLKIITMPINPH